MKFQLTFLVFVSGILMLGGCTAGLPETDPADQIKTGEQVEQIDRQSQVDRVSEAKGTALMETATDEIEQTRPSETVDQTDEGVISHEAGQVEEFLGADDSNQAHVVAKASPENQTEAVSEIEENNRGEGVDELVAIGMGLANVISVVATGKPGSYTFSVGIASPDEGCQKYADWWEVLGEDGELIYRRILLHSHVNEQPFVRSGGPVEITADQIVWVRAHMSPGGFGNVAFRGSVQSGFYEANLSPEFAIETASLSPLPGGCNF